MSDLNCDTCKYYLPKDHYCRKWSENTRPNMSCYRYKVDENLKKSCERADFIQNLKLNHNPWTDWALTKMGISRYER